MSEKKKKEIEGPRVRDEKDMCLLNHYDNKLS